MESNTYLLYSDERVNLKKRSIDFAKKIFKNNNLRYLENDVVYYDELKMDNVRKIISQSSESSYSGIKIFILNMKDIRNEAANALLKVIEEPTKKTIFLLFSYNINKLPKTILSRSIKVYLEPKKYDISDEIYELFDGNNDYLDEYISKKIDINEYSVEETTFLENIDEYLNGDKNIENKINYELAIKYIVNNLRFVEYKKKILMISNLCDIVSKDRNIARKFLDRVLMMSKYKINGEKYAYLVNLKNSLKNNVLVSAVIYIFFNEMLGG